MRVVKYNGMNAEKAICAWIKSEFLMSKKLVFQKRTCLCKQYEPAKRYS